MMKHRLSIVSLLFMAPTGHAMHAEKHLTQMLEQIVTEGTPIVQGMVSNLGDAITQSAPTISQIQNAAQHVITNIELDLPSTIEPKYLNGADLLHAAVACVAFEGCKIMWRFFTAPDLTTEEKERAGTRSKVHEALENVPAIDIATKDYVEAQCKEISGRLSAVESTLATTQKEVTGLAQLAIEHVKTMNTLSVAMGYDHTKKDIVFNHKDLAVRVIALETHKTENDKNPLNTDNINNRFKAIETAIGASGKNQLSIDQRVTTLEKMTGEKKTGGFNIFHRNKSESVNNNNNPSDISSNHNSEQL